MKLSDVKGERVFDVLAEIIEPASKIAQDKSAKALFERKDCPKDMTPSEFMVKRIVKNAPALIKGHKADIIAIMAAIDGVTAEQYEKDLNIVKLTKDVTELLTDKDFIAFFS